MLLEEHRIDIERIWQKASVVQGIDSNLYRKDSAGAWIYRYAYEDMDSIFGWVIDHIFPKALGGDDNLINLRPMNWVNERSKMNDYPHYIADVVSDGNRNIYKRKQCTVNQKIQIALKQLYGK